MLFTVFSPLLNEPIGLFDCVEDAESFVDNAWSEDDAIIQEADACEVMGYRLNTYGL